MEDRQTRMMLILATLFVAMLLVIRFVDPPSEDKEGGELVDVVELGDVIALTLLTQEGSLNAERAAGAWIITTPFQARADDAKLEGLVAMVDSLEAGPELEGADPGKYGLSEPAAVLTLQQADGSARRLSIGMRSPVGFKTYIQLEGEGVRVASGDLLSAAAMPLGSFRDPTVLAFANAEIESLGWSSPLNEWSVTRREGGWWLADGRRADARAVSRTLDVARSLQFETFWDELSEAEAGFDAPSGALTLTDPSGQRRLLLGGARSGGTLARSPEGVVGTVSAVEALDMALVELLEQRLIPATPAELVGLRLTLGERTSSWELVDGAWQQDGAPAADRGVAMMDAVVKAQADRAASPGPLTERAGELVAHTPSQSYTVQLGQAVDGGVVGQDAAGGPSFVVPADTFAALSALSGG